MTGAIYAMELGYLREACARLVVAHDHALGGAPAAVATPELQDAIKGLVRAFARLSSEMEIRVAQVMAKGASA